MSTTKRKSPLPVLMVDETETEKPPLAAAAAASAITITINMKYVLVHPILNVISPRSMSTNRDKTLSHVCLLPLKHNLPTLLLEKRGNQKKASILSAKTGA